VHPPLVLETIDLGSLRADGYVFQIEVTYRAIGAGFSVRECLSYSWIAPSREQDVVEDRARAICWCQPTTRKDPSADTVVIQSP